MAENAQQDREIPSDGPLNLSFVPPDVASNEEIDDVPLDLRVQSAVRRSSSLQDIPRQKVMPRNVVASAFHPPAEVGQHELPSNRPVVAIPVERPAGSPIIDPVSLTPPPSEPNHARGALYRNAKRPKTDHVLPPSCSAGASVVSATIARSSHPSGSGYQRDHRPRPSTSSAGAIWSPIGGPQPSSSEVVRPVSGRREEASAVAVVSSSIAGRINTVESVTGGAGWAQMRDEPFPSPSAPQLGGFGIRMPPISPLRDALSLSIMRKHAILHSYHPAPYILGMDDLNRLLRERYPIPNIAHSVRRVDFVVLTPISPAYPNGPKTLMTLERTLYQRYWMSDLWTGGLAGVVTEMEFAERIMAGEWSVWSPREWQKAIYLTRRFQNAF